MVLDIAIDVIGADVAPLPSFPVRKEFRPATTPGQQIAYRSPHKIISERNVAFLSRFRHVVEDHRLGRNQDQEAGRPFPTLARTAFPRAPNPAPRPVALTAAVRQSPAPCRTSFDHAATATARGRGTVVGRRRRCLPPADVHVAPGRSTPVPRPAG